MANELVSINSASLTPEQYRDLSDIPPETEWLANITNEKTHRFYKSDVASLLRSWA